MNYPNLREFLSSEGRSDEGEKVRLLAVGSRAGVVEVIRTLHSLGYADVGAWSPLLPAPGDGEVMSILTRYRSRS